MEKWGFHVSKSNKRSIFSPQVFIFSLSLYIRVYVCRNCFILCGFSFFFHASVVSCFRGQAKYLCLYLSGKESATIDVQLCGREELEFGEVCDI